MPWTPIAESASRTSSSLNGLMMAVTSFMGSPISVAALERFLDVGHAATSRRVQSRQIGIEKARGVVAGVIGAELDVLEQAFGYGVRDAGFPVGVRGPGVTAAVVPHVEVADVAEQRKAGIADRIRRRQVVIAGAVGLLASRLNPEVVAADCPRALEAHPLPANRGVQLPRVGVEHVGVPRVRIDVAVDAEIVGPVLLAGERVLVSAIEVPF